MNSQVAIQTRVVFGEDNNDDDVGTNEDVGDKNDYVDDYNVDDNEGDFHVMTMLMMMMTTTIMMMMMTTKTTGEESQWRITRRRIIKPEQTIKSQ